MMTKNTPRKKKKKCKNDDDYEQEEVNDNSCTFHVVYSLQNERCSWKRILNNTLKVRAAIEVAFFMSYIHQKWMMHWNLKLENVMLDYAYDVKIIDFDHVGFMNNDELRESLTKGIGTFAYVSPEMANEENYNNKTDVYSYGVVLLTIFNGHLPKQSLKDKINKKPARLPHSSSSISK